MAELDATSSSYYLSLLRRHVLEPVSTAEEHVERERGEIALERDAFRQFADRVADAAPTSRPAPTLPTGTVMTDAVSDETAALRRAYERTIASVPHYDEVYDESIVENASAELGPELASLLRPGTGPAFTSPHKRALVDAVERRATDREEFCEVLDSEIESLAERRRELTAVLDELDTSVVPSWYCDRFEDRIVRILRSRQTTLGAQSTVSYLDGHNLCTYLYHREPWTYPVLTSVARLLDSVTLRE